MSDEELSWRMDRCEKKEETAAASVDDRRYIIVGVSQSQGCTAPQSEPKSWHVFVGRLDPSITADDVKAYMEVASFVDIDVRPLEEKEKWQEKYAAFRIAINIKEKDRIFEKSIWPDGVTVRDWYFKT